MCRVSTIFNWIIISSGTAIVITAIILFVKQVFKNKQNANWHYYIWFILVIRLLVPCTLVSSISIFNAITPAIEKVSTNNSNKLLSITEKEIIEIKENTEVSNDFTPNKENITSDILIQNESNIVNRFSSKFSLKFKLMIVWLIGVLIFGTYIIFINLSFLLRLKKHSRLHNDLVNKVLNECKLALGINNNIEIILTNTISTPSLWGFFRPKLLIPGNILNKLSNDELKHIFLHELSHFKRKDNLINWITIFLKILHWFNPIIWYSFYKMHQDCEIACDAMTMAHMSDKEQESYGYTILHLIKVSSSGKTIPGAMGILSHKSEMKRRITMISLFNKKSFKCSVTSVVILITLSGILLTNSKAHANKIIQNEAKAEALLNSIMLDNLKEYDNKTSQNKVKVETVLSDSDSLSTRSSKTTVDVKTSVSVSDIKGPSLKGKLMTIPNPEKITLGYSLNNKKADKTTSQIAKEKNAVGAVNAGRFNEDLSPAGFMVVNGKVVFNESKDENTKQNTVGFTTKGKLLVGSYTLAQLKDLGIKDAIASCGAALIINGNPITEDISLGINARTAIGQKSDGTVLMLVVDGRSVESIGAKVEDVIDILSKNGAVNACLLDGGSSSTMYFSGNIVNHPCNEKSKERIVPSAFVVLQ